MWPQQTVLLLPLPLGRHGQRQQIAYCAPALLMLVLPWAGLAQHQLKATFRLDPTQSEIEIREAVYTDQDYEAVVQMTRIEDQTVKILTENLDSSPGIREPLEFVWREPSSTLSWRLPSAVSPNLTTAHHTLCPTREKNATLRIRVSTSSPEKVRFRLVVQLVPFYLNLDQPVEGVTVSHTGPEVFHFIFPPGVSEVRVSVRNESESACSLVVVKPAHMYCPTNRLPDNELDLKFGVFTLYQSLLGKAAITAGSYDYPQGMMIILMGKRNPSECFAQSPPNATTSSMLVSLEVQSILDTRVESSLIVLAIFLLVVIVATTCSIKERSYSRREPADSDSGQSMAGQTGGSVRSASRLVNLASLDGGLTSEAGPTVGPSSGPINLSGEPIRASAKPVGRESAPVNQANASVSSEEEKTARRSGLYCRLIALALLFYLLPVVQLVLHHQNSMLYTGNQDICYYNFECLHPWGPILDYGNLFSNVGYVICGFSFLLIVYLRSRYDRQPRNQHIIHRDAEEPNGLYYAMGVSLIGEGILSGCYHICPTGINFQFDTTFMYAISLLIFLKMYQFRHPRSTPPATRIAALLAGLLYVEVLSYFTDHMVFWVFFVLLYLGTACLIIIKIYTSKAPLVDNNVHQQQEEEKLSPESALLVQHSPLPQPTSWPWPTVRRTLRIISVSACNLALGVYILFWHTPGVSSYILLILSLNMAVYFCYYFTFKMYYRFWKKMKSEGVGLFTSLCLVASFLLMGFSGHFYLMEERSSAWSPAQSRNMNAGCHVGIFDAHDLWHFLSALGIFFGFMFILTLEEYNDADPGTRPIF